LLRNTVPSTSKILFLSWSLVFTLFATAYIGYTDQSSPVLANIFGEEVGFSVLPYEDNLKSKIQNQDSLPPKKIKFNHLSVDQGLSHSSVLSLLQDTQGFMWIGTEDGLNKYDGYSFIVKSLKQW